MYNCRCLSVWRQYQEHTMYRIRITLYLTSLVSCFRVVNCRQYKSRLTAISCNFSKRVAVWRAAFIVHRRVANERIRSLLGGRFWKRRKSGLESTRREIEFWCQVYPARNWSPTWSLHGEKLKSGVKSTRREIEVRPGVYTARHGSLVPNLHSEQLKSDLESTGQEIEVRPGVYMARHGSLVSSLHGEKLKSGHKSTQGEIEVWSRVYTARQNLTSDQ